MFKYFKSWKYIKAGVGVYTCDPGTHKVKAEEAQVWSQPGLHSKTLSQKKKKKVNSLSTDWCGIVVSVYPLLSEIFLKRSFQ
jgi:hypothetical protein